MPSSTAGGSQMVKPKGWDLYFPEEAFSVESHIPPIIEEITQWLRRDGRSLLRNADYTNLFRVQFDFKELSKCPVDGFLWAIAERPKEALATIGCSVYEALFAAEHGNDVPQEDMVDPPEQKLNARIMNWEPMTPMKYLKSNCIGKFVSVRGTVIRVSTIKPVLVAMTFVCAKCGYECKRHLPDGKYEPPSSCLGCKSKSLVPDRSTAVTVDWQRVRLQEIVTDDSREEGRMPRTIECELSEDLVDHCVPGDEVTVSGVVKVVSTEGESKGSKNKCLFLLYIEANSIANPKKNADGGEESHAFTSIDLGAINEIAHEGDPMRLLVNSVCPAIWGQEMVKLALCLAVFGGSPDQESLDDKNKISVRSDLHVLVVGEPGLGKSQMLQAISGLAPRGVYVCGNTTSTAGLTVTVVKDAASGDFALEAGALVLGDQGVCCIDEFDKMGGEQQALLEAMEQQVRDLATLVQFESSDILTHDEPQSISVAKAGIVCSLSARCAVIAAANPIGGHYDRGKTVNENLKMPRAILSRFDVIFILLDDPDADRDRMLSEHVMALHSNRHSHSTATSQAPSLRHTPGPSQRRPAKFGREFDEDSPSLFSRLQLQQGEKLDPVPGALLRKYIAYARRYCFPKLSDEAKVVLQRFYTLLRKRNHTMDSTPITTRQLEALVRLTQARAKMELRELATEQDAQEIVELMKESLFDTMADDSGVVDFSRTSGSSKAKELRKLKSLLYKVAEEECNNLFKSDEIYDIATSNGIPGTMVEELIESLNSVDQCLLKKPQRTWQLTGTSTIRPSQAPIGSARGRGSRY